MIIPVEMDAPGWKSFADHIVLTGGVGIKFLKLADKNPGKSFLEFLKSSLPEGCKVERSQLSKAAERESYLFCRQIKKRDDQKSTLHWRQGTFFLGSGRQIRGWREATVVAYELEKVRTVWGRDGQQNPLPVEVRQIGECPAG